jgi:hypothetical protein
MVLWLERSIEVSQRSLPMHLAELPSESELGEVDISRWLMTRRNVASYDCRSDVAAGLPGIAYVMLSSQTSCNSLDEYRMPFPLVSTVNKYLTARLTNSLLVLYFMLLFLACSSWYAFNRLTLPLSSGFSEHGQDSELFFAFVVERIYIFVMRVD